MPSGQVTTMACALGQTMQELKEHLASELRMPADKLVFMFDGKIFVDVFATICLCIQCNHSFLCINVLLRLYRLRIAMGLTNI